MTEQQRKRQTSSPQADINFEDYIYLFMLLLQVGEALCGQTNGQEAISQEVASITQGRALLLLHQQTSSEQIQAPSTNVVASFPVQFVRQFYGTLVITPSTGQTASPALPLPVAHLLAQTCGLILYTLELSAILHSQSQHFEQQTPGSLTKRQREVLVLMCRGYDQEAIARTLSITPETVRKYRHRIYTQLGVHNERDVLLAAYSAGLFSPLEDISY